MKHRSQNWIAIALAVWAGSCVFKATELPAADETPVPAKTPVSGPVSAMVMTNAALQKIEYPQSQFAFAPGVGRDPFHPQSTRRTTPIAKPEPTVVEEPKPTKEPSIIPDLPTMPAGPVREVDPDEGTSFFALKGILATRSRRLVTLSSTVKSYIFTTGDEMMIRVPDGKMRVRCIEIRSRSAVFQLEGKRDPVEFFLRDNL